MNSITEYIYDYAPVAERREEAFSLLYNYPSEIEELIGAVFYHDCHISSRAGNLIDHYSRKNPDAFQNYTDILLENVEKIKDNIPLWCVLGLLGRLRFNENQKIRLFEICQKYTSPSFLPIVRINSLETFTNQFSNTHDEIDSLYEYYDLLESEQIPSLNARIKKLRKKIEQKQRLF